MHMRDRCGVSVHEMHIRAVKFVIGDETKDLELERTTPRNVALH